MDFKFKTILIGDYSSGKTSILRRLNNEVFNNTYTSTIGVDYLKKTFDHEEIYNDIIYIEDEVAQYNIVHETKLKNFKPKNINFKKYHSNYIKNEVTKNIEYNLSIWDTSGQEKFSFLTSTYYRNISSAIIVFDITNYNSFKALDMWIKDLFQKLNDESKPYFPIIIVGNKSDLDKTRVISKKEASEYVGKLGFKYIECSAKNDFNIFEIFKELIKEIVFRINNELITPNKSNGIEVLVNDKSLFSNKNNIVASDDEMVNKKCCQIM